MVILVPAPLLATAETEARSLGRHRFLSVREPGDEPWATDRHRSIGLTCLIASAADVTHPFPRRLPLVWPGGALACFLGKLLPLLVGATRLHLFTGLASTADAIQVLEASAQQFHRRILDVRQTPSVAIPGLCSC